MKHFASAHWMKCPFDELSMWQNVVLQSCARLCWQFKTLIFVQHSSVGKLNEAFCLRPLNEVSMRWTIHVTECHDTILQLWWQAVKFSWSNKLQLSSKIWSLFRESRDGKIILISVQYFRFLAAFLGQPLAPLSEPSQPLLEWRYSYLCPFLKGPSPASHSGLSNNVVVAQLIQRSLPTPECPWFESSHWQNFYIEHLHTANCIEKTKIKKKKLGIVRFLKNQCNYTINKCETCKYGSGI